MKNEEFYIGYLEKAPVGIAKHTKRVVGFFLSISVVVAVLFVIGQKSFYPSTFEFLNYRTFEGVVQEHPYPMLRVMQPNGQGALPSYSHFYLVNEGKAGAQEAVASLNGQRVKLEGALIYRDDQVMIEIKPGTVETLQGGMSGSTVEKSLGPFTLSGEVVDSKCFLGVMNPGDHKTHRACATRCISGGIPPLFVVKNGDGEVSYLLLVSENGESVRTQILDKIAEPLEITGQVVQQGDVLLLKSDPTTYRRLNP
ncbi:MAG: hypothetical protein KTR29_18405 [Rhodothermaceae bacterium]|nr:hypothetical protein [Rhodothermaceae bacterium]